MESDFFLSLPYSSLFSVYSVRFFVWIRYIFVYFVTFLGRVFQFVLHDRMEACFVYCVFVLKLITKLQKDTDNVRHNTNDPCTRHCTASFL